MANYAKEIPVDRFSNPMQEYPPAASAIGITVRENGAASSVTSFQANTTTIEVAAIATGAAIRWATNQASSVVTAAGTANFDHIVPVNTVRKFVVPRTVQGNTTSIVGLGAQNGLFSAVGTISLGVGSVLLTQY